MSGSPKHPAASSLDPALFGFPCEVAQLTGIQAVGAALLRHTAPLGFETYVIGALPAPGTTHPPPFTVDNLPDWFWARYIDAEMARYDPALRALAMTAAPVSFSQIRAGEAGFRPTARERAVLDIAAGLGTPEGFLVPVFRAQGYRGLVVLIGRGPDPHGPVRAALRFLAEYAHDRMREIFAATTISSRTQLTAREVELMALAQRGLNDEQIADVTAITVRTVRFHFANVRRKLQARSRAEAIAMAVNLHLLPR